MKNKKLEANLSMAVSKIFSGLNMNALKYLLPLWMSPLTGATLRCTFAAAAFWVIGWFMPPEKSSAKDKWLLFLLGAFGLYGFMFLYLAGLSKTTPVSSSIFTSLQPIWVFLIMIFFYKEKATWKKILGISIGLVGALVCILTQQSDDLASDAFVGNMLCLISSIVDSESAYPFIYRGDDYVEIYIFRCGGLRYYCDIYYRIRCAGVLYAVPLDTFPDTDVCTHISDDDQLYVASGRSEVSENNSRRNLRLSDSDCCDHCFSGSRTGPF